MKLSISRKAMLGHLPYLSPDNRFSVSEVSDNGEEEGEQLDQTLGFRCQIYSVPCSSIKEMSCAPRLSTRAEIPLLVIS